MNHPEELRDASKSLRTTARESSGFRWDNYLHIASADQVGYPVGKSRTWVDATSPEIADPLGRILDNLAHTWDRNEQDTNHAALAIARRINQAHTAASQKNPAGR